jgi:hypothetical protein
MKLPDSGLYRTTQPYPGHETDIPAGVLVYVGMRKNGGLPFVVRPSANRNNRWFWSDPVTQLRAMSWAETLFRLPPEGFYTLPEEISFDSGGRWLKNAVVQLGYNPEGRGIIFVGEQHEGEERNILVFSAKGRGIADEILFRLQWAPILPVEKGAAEAADD